MPSSAALGLYDGKVVDPKGQYVTLRGAFTILDEESDADADTDADADALGLRPFWTIEFDRK